MTSNRSAEKNNVFLHNAAEKIRMCLPLYVCTGILCLVASATLAVGALKSAGANTLNFNYLTVSEFFYGLAFTVTISSTLFCFRQLWKKTAADMEYSVPLGIRGKFFSDLSAAVFINLSPFLVSCFIMLIGFLIGYAKYEGKVVVPATEYTQGVVSHLFGSLLVQLGMFTISGILLIALAMSMTIFVAACCGKIEETVFYLAIFCILIPTGLQMIPTIMINYSLGAYSTGSELISGTSPITGFLQIMGLADQFAPPSKWLESAAIMLAAAAVFAVSSYFIYIGRRAEQTGSVLTSRPILAAVEFVIMLTGISYTIALDKGFIPVLFAAYIITAEVVYNIKRPAVKRSLIKIAVMASAVALFIGIANATNKFGAVTRIPSADKIESVHIETNIGAGYGSWEADLTAPEEIEKIRELQQSLIDFYLDNKKEIDKIYKYMYIDGYISDEVASFGDASITYTLKNGNTVHRFYMVDYDSFYNYISIANMDGAKKAAAEKITADLDYVENCVFSYRSFNMFGAGQNYDFDDISDDYSSRLAEALRTDIENETYEQYTHRPMPVGDIEIMLPISQIRVYPHYVNTLAVLREKIDIDTSINLADTENAAIFKIKTPDEKATDFDFENKFFTRSILERYTWSYYADDYKQEPPLLCLEYLKEKLPSGEYEDVIGTLENIIANSYSTYVGEGDFTVITGISWYDNAIIPDEYAEAARELKKYEITPDEYIKWHEEWEKGKKQN